ncbi:GNAT family N-acetyltransferase [Parapedomonas caeni]|jgi:ribosomal protein S18 acetylase RimI-like enzyme
MTISQTDTAATVVYALEPDLAAADFRDILVRSTLAERRPVDDLDRLATMVARADIIVTARAAGRLVGVSRAITDYAFCCYLSDLAVDVACQRQGIGRRLIEETRVAAGPRAKLYLSAAPAARDYYPRIGMDHEPDCWSFPRRM